MRSMMRVDAAKDAAGSGPCTITSAGRTERVDDALGPADWNPQDRRGSPGTAQTECPPVTPANRAESARTPKNRRAARVSVGGVHLYNDSLPLTFCLLPSTFCLLPFLLSPPE